MNVTELIDKGLLQTQRDPKHRKGWSTLVFMEGKQCIPQPPKNVRLPRVLISRTPDFGSRRNGGKSDRET
jgi:hypothetical protein